MTNNEITEAARLIGEIEQLERLDLQEDDTFSLARDYRTSELRVSYRDLRLLTYLDNSFTREIVSEAIAKKKARLNDLRSGC